MRISSPRTLKEPVVAAVSELQCLVFIPGNAVVIEVLESYGGLDAVAYIVCRALTFR